MVSAAVAPPGGLGHLARGPPSVRRATAANAAVLAPHAHAGRLGLATVGSFYDVVADLGRAARMDAPPPSKPRIAAADGQHHYDAARASRRGVIVLTAHLGNFEVGLVALLSREREIHVVFRRDAFGTFEQTRSTLRQRLGVHEAPVDDGLATWLRLREVLAVDGAVVMQGRPARCPARNTRPSPSAARHCVCRSVRSSSPPRQAPRYCLSSPAACPAASCG